jgi:hypothetical protein
MDGSTSITMAHAAAAVALAGAGNPSTGFFPPSGWSSRKQRRRARGGARGALNAVAGDGWFRSLTHEDGPASTAILRANSYLSVRGRPSIKKLGRAVRIANTPVVMP